MSDSERHALLAELFEAVLERPDEERDAFLAQACGDDREMLDDLRALLRADAAQAPLFLPTPPSLRRREPQAEGGEAPEEGILERLSTRYATGRYRIVGELGRGGMGVILRVWDDDLRRQLAMKVTLGPVSTGMRRDLPPTPHVDARSVGRFLEEAQITSQLDHPNIVPVHELGVDDEGRAYFTMRLVKGRTLHEVLELLRAGRERWTRARVLGVLLKVCEAMAYAHSHGVIHRDIKPANVMVGRFGEVYVMDWGLGHVIGMPETRDLRVRLDDTAGINLAAGPLYTMDGDVIGTPAYMSPEQAQGQILRMGPRSDVYAIGAILYEILAGRAPYSDGGSAPSARATLIRIYEGPPEPLRVVAPKAAPELVAIAERAMARAPEDRYPEVGALAEDLSAFLEGRVVKAYRTGPIVEFVKWVRRNRAVAAATGALILLFLLSGFGVGWQERARRHVVERGFVEREAAALTLALDRAWPIHPRWAGDMEAWLDSARALGERLEPARAELDALDVETAAAVREEDPSAATAERDAYGALELRRRRELFAAAVERKRAELETGPEDERAAFLAFEIAVLEAEVLVLAEDAARLEAEEARRRGWRFADPPLERRYRRAFQLVQDLERILGDGGVPAVEHRLAQARGLWDVSVGAHAAAWDRAIASISDPVACPRYGGLVLTPQIGLVPLGRDPQSGLWEFWHVLSGERPEGRPGALRVQPETGIVLVLIPGGLTWLGAQEEDPDGHNYVDPQAPDAVGAPAEPAGARRVTLPNEWPVHAVELDPYFLSKYEMTQGQWRRSTARSPSLHPAGVSYSTADPDRTERISRTHPVESVTWHEAVQALSSWSLSLPTEAQWEHGARAGTESAYWWGDSFDALAAEVNFADRAVELRGVRRVLPLDVDDGWSTHAPVDAFRPNRNGLFHVTGNVREWCRDWVDRARYAGDRITAGDAEHVPALGRSKATRGGGFYRSEPFDLRLARRVPQAPMQAEQDLGVRPARKIDVHPLP